MRHLPDTNNGYDRQVTILVKIVGSLALAVGAAVTALAAWFLYRLVVLGRIADFVALAAVSGFAVISVFFLSVGWRLFLNRPNRYGSILGPASWRILGAPFGLLAIVLLGFMVTKPAPIDIFLTAVISVVSSSVFSFWCFRAAQRAAAHPRKANVAL